MSETTNIAWCDATWNPWRGCRKVSAGCANCYAEKLVNRFGGDFAKRVRSADATFNAPLRWNKNPWVCDDCGEVYSVDMAKRMSGKVSCASSHKALSLHRRRVFSLSLGDWLDPEVPIEWLADMLDIIRRCPNLDFLLLTKRPELWEERMSKVLALQLKDDIGHWIHAWFIDDAPPHNIWLGVTVENQEQADRRIPELLKIPAKVRFLSVEPLLGPVDLLAVKTGDGDGPSNELIWIGEGAGIDWVIIGGESGPKARECDISWIGSIVSQCQAASVPVFVKQLGSLCTTPNANMHDWPEQVQFLEYGTGYAAARAMLMDPKGGDPSEWPSEFQVQEFPEVNHS